jgi:two-component system, NtrC family, sensor kinase
MHAMAIANILLVDIALPEFNSQCASHGYEPVMVPDIPSMLDVEASYAIVLINQELIGDALLADMERLYFLASGAPIAVFITDHERIADGLRRALDEGTLERMYAHEVVSGLALSRIDRIYLTSCLDASVRAYQQNASENAVLHREITLRNRVLDHERELNANITGSITSGLVIIDMAGNIFLINEYARKHLRITASDIMGVPFRQVFPEKVCRFVDNSLKKINIQWRRHEMKKITIEETVLEIATYRMNDYDRTPTGMLMLINDITEQENTTVQLFRSEKLATVGTMLSGIAHELRNPLSIISARSQMALKKEDWDRPWAMKNFESIDGQVNRCASIINSLLDFTRYKATKPGQHQVSEILDETLTYVEYQNIFDAIKVEKQYEDGLAVYGDRSRFVQIFLNIILNAADAMNGKGDLRLSTSSDEHSRVLVEIHDTGGGIDPAVKDRIFDPFFTTKEPGKGTGLGLAVAYKIIQESGGELWFTSEPNNTSFFVRLPSGKKKNL